MLYTQNKFENGEKNRCLYLGSFDKVMVNLDFNKN